MTTPLTPHTTAGNKTESNQAAQRYPYVYPFPHGVSAHADTFTRDNLPARAAWPDLLCSHALLDYPAQLNITTALLDDALAKNPHHASAPAVMSCQVCWDYGTLHTKVNQICHVLVHDLGLQPGNRVLLRGANSPMMAACVLAVWKAGLVAVATMPLLRGRDLAVVIDKAQVVAALCASSLKAELIDAQGITTVLKQVVYFDDTSEAALETRMASKPTDFAAVNTAADDVCHIAFTSGTTGVPKGTMHFHRDILAACDTFGKTVLQAKPSDRFIGTPPLAFTFGLGGLLVFALRAGASTVLLEKLSPDSLLKAIEDFKATTCFTAPTFYRLMTPLAEQFNLQSLHTCVSAGEALPAATRLAWLGATGIQMLDGIGATEMFHIFIGANAALARAGATGVVVPGYEAKIVDEQGHEVTTGVVGKLAVRGPTGCRYLADKRQGNYVKDGWNFTGDAYYKDADGYFWYQARTDDMIISAGYNIGAPEVENSILTHPGVAECAVIGVADETRGQIVKAFVVLKAGFIADETMITAIQDHVKADIAPYKYPRAVEFRDVLPKTETGKLQRFKLKQEG